MSTTPDMAKMTGAERAAILLMTLGEERASTVLQHLEVDEVQKLGRTMAAIGKVSSDQVGHALRDLVSTAEGETTVGMDAESYLEEMLVRAFGKQRGGRFVDRILTGRGPMALEALEWMDTVDIVDMLCKEHPQIIAIVLSCLDSDRAAEVLAELPAEMRPDVVLRIAALDDVQQSALQELAALVAQHSARSAERRRAHLGGEKVAAQLLGALSPSEEEEVMEKIREKDGELGQRLADQMFAFEKLLEVDDRGVQTILREISTDVLALALKAAEPQMQEKFFRNISKRAASMLREDMETRGPVKLSEVEEAQKQILDTARKLAEAGEIAMGGSGDEYV